MCILRFWEAWPVTELTLINPIITITKPRPHNTLNTYNRRETVRQIYNGHIWRLSHFYITFPISDSFTILYIYWCHVSQCPRLEVKVLEDQIKLCTFRAFRLHWGGIRVILTWRRGTVLSAVIKCGTSPDQSWPSTGSERSTFRLASSSGFPGSLLASHQFLISHLQAQEL